MKGKEESPEKKLNETEASNLSDIEFKIMAIKILKELSENYKELYGSYKELSGNYSNMRNDKNYEQEPGRNEEYNT